MAGVNVSKSYKNWMELKIAVQDGNIKHLKKLLRRKGVNMKDENGWSLLHCVSELNMSVNISNKIIELLLKNGIEIDSEDEHGQRALMIASSNGYSETVKLLLEHKANVDAQNADGWSSLMFACLKGESETARVPLEYRANLNEQNKDGLSALMITSREGHTETVKLLLCYSASVNDQNKDRMSALMIASLEGHTETVKLLLCYSASVNDRNKDGMSALMIASREGHTETVKLLLCYSANVNDQNKDGMSALMIASREGHTETVKLLLDCSASINDQDKDGWCALMFACQNGHFRTVKLLLELMTIQDVKFSLEDHRVDINQQNKDGCTSLIIAVASETIARSRQIKIVKCLLKHGADVIIKDKSGRSAIDYAIKPGDIELAKHNEYDHQPSIKMTQHRTQYSDLEYSTNANQNGHNELATLLVKHGDTLDYRCSTDGRTILMIAVQRKDIKTIKQVLEFGAM